MDDLEFDDIVPLADAVFAGAASDPGRYGPLAVRLVERARREGPVEALVVALRAQAEAERLALHNAAARAVLDEAVRLAERHGLDRRLGQLLVTRVVVQHELGHLTAAQHDVDRAARLLPTTERSDLVFQQGVLLQNLGRLAQAAPHYRAVLADPACPPVVQAKAGNNLAHLESELGHLDTALALLDHAQEVAARVGPTVLAYLAQTRAWVEVRAGRLSQSLAGFSDAQQLFERAGLSLGGHHLEHSDALADLLLVPEALDAARRGLAALPEDEASLMAAEAHLRIARLLLLTGEPSAASTAVERSAGLLRSQRRTGWLARAAVVGYEARARTGALAPADLRGLRRRAADLEGAGMRSDAVEAHLLAGRLSLDAGQRVAGLTSLSAAQRLSRGAPVLVRLRGHLAAALRADADGRAGAVITSCRAGMVDLDRHRRALPTMELRVLASGHGEELGVRGLRALLPERPTAGASARTGPARVFAWLERTRAAALAPLEAPPHEDVERELAGLRALHAELAGAPEGSGTAVVLLHRITEAEAAVRRASWSPAPGGQAAAPTERAAAPLAARVREELDGGVLVEYAVLDGRLLAIAVDRRRTRLVELGPLEGLPEQVDALLFALRRLARPPLSAPASAAAHASARAALDVLAGRLVRPLSLDPAAPLVIVPVGQLQRVPWAPLHRGPVTVAPSASVWLRTRQRPPRAGGVALIAGPDLPGAAREVAALRALHPEATVLAPPESTCRAGIEALRVAGLAHIACHGRLRADNPVFSTLLLCDGPLTVHELSRRDGVPARIVLAACESGAQVAFRGGEAMGFVTTLLCRGSAGVLASSALVPDDQALPLMHALHRQLAGGATLADALWAARAVLDAEDPARFAAWCAFEVYGAA